MPLTALKYILISTVMVPSFIFGMRMIFAHDMRREFWRSSVKRSVYFSQSQFKRVSSMCGWFLLVLSLFVSYISFIDLMN